MRSLLVRDKRGSVAIEFAVVGSAMLSFFTAAVALSVAMWTQNVLQRTAEQGARCAAIGSSQCAAVTSGCDSASPVVCYTESAATQMGVASLAAGNISVNGNIVYAGTAFSKVAITYNLSMLGYTLTLSGTGLFPNQAATWGQSP